MTTKTEYILKQLNKTGGKQYERYVVHKIFNDLFNHPNNLSLKFTCQQYVKRSDNAYALLDMYIPSIQVQVEVDEGHHNNLKNKEADKIRQKEINEKIENMSALDKTQIIDISNQTNNQFELIRIAVTDDEGKVLDLEVINQNIKIKVEKIRTRINEINPSPWDYETEYSWKKYRGEKTIKVSDSVELRYISDVYNIFGGKIDDSEFQESAQARAYWAYTRNQKDQKIWCPKKGDGKWDNLLDDDGKFILEKINPDKKKDKKTSNEKECRVTFYHSKDNLGQTFYRFCGVFEFTGTVYKKGNEYSKYEKISDEIEINPVQC